MLCQRLEVECIMAVESQYYCLHYANVVDIFNNTVTEKKFSVTVLLGLTVI